MVTYLRRTALEWHARLSETLYRPVICQRSNKFLLRTVIEPLLKLMIFLFSNVLRWRLTTSLDEPISTAISLCVVCITLFKSVFVSRYRFSL